MHLLTDNIFFQHRSLVDHSEYYFRIVGVELVADKYIANKTNLLPSLHLLIHAKVTSQ